MFALGTIDEQKLKEVLLKGAYIDASELEKTSKLSQEQKKSLPDLLVDSGALTKDLLGQAIAEVYKVKYVDLDATPTTKDHTTKLEEKLAREKRVIFISENASSVIVASDSPTADIPEMVARSFGGKKVELRYALPELINTALKLYDKPLSSRFSELFSHAAFAPEVVDNVIEDALNLNVSDIHFEPREQEIVVRFRIDGVLLEVARIPKKYYENILNRIKVLAHLPIDEHFRTQDGSIRHAYKDSTVNVRISVAPTLDGEKIALRLLSGYINKFSVDTLGLASADRDLFLEAARKPFGMILVTGPTGSGKTTTLYAFLNLLNSTEINITTIEDPVEYKIEGVNQMQANLATDLTFARGLRSIVRQDPDIVLVGEIRDKETAEIAVNAALTGHLLLSTFHSNDAATTIPRLLDMGIEPFLLSSTLELIVAQRLLRRICEHCRVSYTITKADLCKISSKLGPYFKGSGQFTLYRGKGCEVCHNTGYKGRVAIFEMIRNTPEMQELVSRRPGRNQIVELAKTQNFRTLFDDGLSKVKEGISTIDELLRVATPESQKA